MAALNTARVGLVLVRPDDPRLHGRHLERDGARLRAGHLAALSLLFGSGFGARLAQ